MHDEVQRGAGDALADRLNKISRALNVPDAIRSRFAFDAAPAVKIHFT